MAGYLPHLGPRNWFYTNQTGGACYDDVHCEDQCCRDMDFGLPYCCSKYMGLVYLGLTIGSGLVIAVLMFGCYICMTKKERELQAAAKLEAIKAANNQSQQTTQGLSSNSYGDHNSTATELSYSPPTYSDVMSSDYSRCQSFETSVTSQQTLDLVTLFVRQHSQRDHGLHYPLPPLPPLVDVSALIAHHRLEHGQHSAGALPPVSSQISIDDKLPSYEQCVSGLLSANVVDDQTQGVSSTYSHVVDVEGSTTSSHEESYFTKTSEDLSTLQLTDVHIDDHSMQHRTDVEIESKLNNDSHFINVVHAVRQLRVTEIIGQAVEQATDDMVNHAVQQMTNEVVDQSISEVRRSNHNLCVSRQLYRDNSIKEDTHTIKISSPACKFEQVTYISNDISRHDQATYTNIDNIRQEPVTHISTNNSRQEQVTYTDIDNIRQEPVTYISTDNIWPEQVTYTDNSRQEQITYTDNSRQVQVTYTDNSRQEQVTYTDNSRQEKVTYTDNSGQEQVICNDNSMQEQITYTNNSRQEHVTYTDNSMQEQIIYSGTENSRQEQVTYTDNNRQEQVTYTDNSRQEQVNYTDNSRQEQVTYTDNSGKEQVIYTDNNMQEQITYTDNSRQEHVTYTDNSMLEQIIYSGTDNSRQEQVTYTEADTSIQEQITYTDNRMQEHIIYTDTDVK